jgi:hypothetical protein
MTVKDAAIFLGKSTKTIRRYIADGCDLTPASLREFSDHADMRARGRAANLVFDRPAGSVTAISGSRMPGDASRALAALDTLESLKTAFSKRLDRARTQSLDLEVELLSEELGMLAESARLLAAVLEGHEVYLG